MLLSGGVPWGKSFWPNTKIESRCPKRKQAVHGSTIPDMSRYLQTLSKIGESPEALCARDDDMYKCDNSITIADKFKFIKCVITIIRAHRYNVNNLNM